MTSEQLTLDCKKHGKSTATLVCRHLIENKKHPLGFIENNSDPDDLQAWCYACEYFFQQQEDMTDEFKVFSDVGVVCQKCYDIIKSKHSISALFKSNS